MENLIQFFLFAVYVLHHMHLVHKMRLIATDVARSVVCVSV